VIYIENQFGIRFGDLEALELESIYDLVLLTHRYYSEKRNHQALARVRIDEIAQRSRLKDQFK